MAHLTYEQRYTIEVLLKTKKAKSEIAKTLSVDKSIIYREIKRNYDGRSGEYKAILTQYKYEFRLENNQKLMFSNFCHVVKHFYYLLFIFFLFVKVGKGKKINHFFFTLNTSYFILINLVKINQLCLSKKSSN